MLVTSVKLACLYPKGVVLVRLLESNSSEISTRIKFTGIVVTLFIVAVQLFLPSYSSCAEHTSVCFYNQWFLTGKGTFPLVKSHQFMGLVAFVFEGLFHVLKREINVN